MYISLIQKLPSNLISFVPLILFIVLIYKWLIVFNTKKLQLPPSPPKLPIIGNLHQLGKLPHRSLRTLSQKYGDLMMLHLGNRPTLVVSSATAAEHIFKTHDLAFANRPKLRFINKIFYDGNDVAFSSYGEKWRQRKSICVTKLLNNQRVKSFRTIREEEVGWLIEEIKSYRGEVMNLSEILLTHFKGLTCRTALGRKYKVGEDGENGAHFYDVFKELVDVMGEVSVGDYIPLLGWIDRFTGLERRAENIRKKFDQFLEQVIQEHHIRLNSKQHDENEQDFVDCLLEIQRENPHQLSRENIKAITLDIFAAGTETSSTTLEWAMTELIRHPNIMKRLQEEVRWIVKTNTSVTEDDLEKMKYIKAVIKETLRLHPPLPLLVFHETSQDVKIMNYDIAAKTQVIINASAIHTDPKFWDDPEDFNPERFLDISMSIDFKGHHFQYVPFGAGRRGCPGIAYSFVNVELVLASLVCEFNWALPNRDGVALDIDERAGIAVSRLNPLKIIATQTPNKLN